MSELGSGSGSSYPGSLDTDDILEVNRPNAGMTKARAEVPNDLAAAIIAVETELGTNPAGSLTDVKTFLQTEHGTDGTHTALSTAVVMAVTDGSNTIKTKVINIGDWNMDTTSTVSVAHGLTYAKIRAINISIRNDADNATYQLNHLEDVPVTGWTTQSWNATNIILTRTANAFFDSSDFDATSFNRGWITITYVA